jgi:flagellin
MRADGLLLNFIATDDLLGTNPSGNPQLYQFDFMTGSLHHATNYEAYTIVGIGDTISRDGLTVVNTLSGPLLRYNFKAPAFHFSISTGSGAIDAIQTSIQSLSGALHGLGSQLITTESAARGALDVVRSNFEELAALRGQLGAGGSQPATAFSLITSAAAETQTARPRITDIDFASEEELLTHNQIRQQVGAAILAQVNLQPSLVLELLSITGR